MSELSAAAIPSKIAGDIVVAFLEKNVIEASRLPALVRDVLDALTRGGSRDAAPPKAVAEPVGDSARGRSRDLPDAAPDDTRPTPAVPVEQSVTPDHIISLEDGRPFRSLTRHLKARYGLTPDQYRVKWGLPGDYPMVAPNYAEQRSAIAKRIGLGGPVAKRAQPSGKTAAAKRTTGQASDSTKRRIASAKA